MSVHKDGGAYFSGDVTFAADVEVHGTMTNQSSQSIGTYTTQKIITNAEILTLRTSPITIVPAAGSLKAIIPIAYWIDGTFETGYGNSAGAELLLKVGFNGFAAVSETDNNFFSSGGSFGGIAWTAATNNTVFDPTSATDLPVTATVTNTGDITGGHANNYLVISLSWVVLNDA